MLVSEFYEGTPEIINREFQGINVKFIDGKTGNRKFCTGYCNNNIHKGCLNDKIIKQHGCYEKECSFFFTNVDLFFSEIRKIKKEEEKREKEKLSQIIRQCDEVAKSFDGIRVTDVSQNGDMFEIEYVTVCSNDISLLELKLQNTINSKILIKEKKCDYDTAVRLFLEH